MVDNDTITPLRKLVDDDKGLQFLTFFLTLNDVQWFFNIFQPQDMNKNHVYRR